MQQFANIKTWTTFATYLCTMFFVPSLFLSELRHWPTASNLIRQWSGAGAFATLGTDCWCSTKRPSLAIFRTLLKGRFFDGPISGKQISKKLSKQLFRRQIWQNARHVQKNKNLGKTTRIVAAFTFGPWDPSEEMRLAARILAKKIWRHFAVLVSILRHFLSGTVCLIYVLVFFPSAFFPHLFGIVFFVRLFSAFVLTKL